MENDERFFLQQKKICFLLYTNIYGKKTQNFEKLIIFLFFFLNEIQNLLINN